MELRQLKYFITSADTLNFTEAARQYRDEHWEDDLQQAYDAGRRMAEKIIG